MKDKKEKNAPLAVISANSVMRLSEFNGSANPDATFIGTETNEGIRIYRDTLCFMFETAVNAVYRYSKNVRIGNSIGDGYYFYFADGYVPDSGDRDEILREMDRLHSSGVVVESVMADYSDALKIFSERGMTMTVRLIESLSPPSVRLYRCEDTYKVAHEVLCDSFAPIASFELMNYNDGFLLRYPRKSRETVADDWHDNRFLYDVVMKDRRRSNSLSVDSIGKLNMVAAGGGARDYIEVSENIQKRDIMEVADSIKERGSVKMVFVAGPSSSNKTTFANRLCFELKTLGYQTTRISLDDYYLTKDKVPKDEFGEPDLECLEAIDVDLFKENLRILYSGGEVNLPHFEFNYNGIGRRTFAKGAIRLRENDVLVVEGIHALNSVLTEGIDKASVFRIYISPFIQLNLDDYTRIRTTDLRILRRLVRDYRTRGASALETFSMWDSVEKGERKYIFPYQNDVDAVINSAHGYEIAVLSAFALPLLRSVRPTDGISCYMAARRLVSLIENISPISSSLIPSDSMLHEFIG